MITKIAWKNIWYKPLNTALSIILLMASVAIITLLILLEEQFEKKFNDNIAGTDMVLGAQGSPLQLILSAIYQVDAPTGNINYEEAKVLMHSPMVKEAVPLAFGDNYKGYRIVGTEPVFLSHYNAKIAQGAIFSKNFDVVLGNDVAKKMNLKIGDKFFGSHGDAAEGEVHESHAYVLRASLRHQARYRITLYYAISHRFGKCTKAMIMRKMPKQGRGTAITKVKKPTNTKSMKKIQQLLRAGK